MRKRKVPYLSDIHCLLGSTLRDSSNERTGTVVGINQYNEYPSIEVRWSDEQRIERVELTAEQLDSLVKLARERATVQPQPTIEATGYAENVQQSDIIRRRA